ncbi:hypothetical protein L1987_72412 [Smallanthus sonchifolius]|uniref:Uncharacterized protein n=1 Tax=Smallanthus sonchifolius TaxID=185202 RepID=A0ACB9AV51_9ASTR|nr:hypothetical protein L1987_72412 [Smallanthus sonchifolius]
MAAENANFQVPSVPKFDGDYEHWSLLMKTLLRSKEYWVVIEPGYNEPREGVELTATQQASLEAMRLKDLKAQNYLFQSIDKQIIKTMTHKETAKQIWEAMKIKYQGNDRVKKAKLQRLRRDFETLEMKEGEGVTEYFARVMTVANDMRNWGDEMPDVKVVEKILRSLTENFNFVVCTIEESKDIDMMTVDELQSSLLVHEPKLSRQTSASGDQVLKSELESPGGRGRGRGRGSSYRGRGRGRGRSRADFDKSGVECYRCHQMGHFAYECNRGEKQVNYAEFDEEEGILLMTQATVDIEQKSGIWFLDSACSNNMTGNRAWFISFDEEFTHTVKLGNDLRLSVKGIGDVKLVVEGKSQVITRVYYVPDLTSSLLSVGQLQEKNVTVIIKQGVCRIYHPQRGLIITSNMTRNRMFLVNATMVTRDSICYKMEEEDVDQLWHRRLGHVNNKSLRTMQFRRMVEGLPRIAEASKSCEVCNLGKQKRENMSKKSLWKASARLELIHVDLCGPINPISPSGKRYVMVIIDDMSRKGWVYFLENKFESLDYFKKFKVMVENETGLKIKGLRSDRGGEFTSKRFNEFCETHGIKRQLTTAYTPQQNGVAERRNLTLMNMVRCLLIEKNMPKWFWSEATSWGCHILNRCVTTSVESMVPEERWSGRKPNVEDVKVFGCIGYVLIPSQLRTKLDNRSTKCIFLGISKESKAYRMYDPIQRKVIISKYVKFVEGERWEWDREGFVTNELIIPDGERLENQEREGGETQDEVTDHAIGQSPLQSQNSENTNEGSPTLQTHNPSSLNTPSPSDSTQHSSIQPENNTQQRIRDETSRRNTHPPAWLKDYNSGEELSDDEAVFAMISSLEDPVSFEEAVKETKWVKAMESEIQSIMKNNTWELVDPPKGTKPIGVKWLFKTKRNERGEVDKYKARLVVKGYAQRKGIDYDEIYAPVARWDTVRSIVAIAAQRGWNIYQLDVKCAFLNGELKETVFIDQPQGFVKGGEEHKVCKLNKALYGLKQAPRAWFNRIEGYFLKEGFTKSYYDHTLFIKKASEGMVIVSLYVDDLIYTGSNEGVCENFKVSMMHEFEMTNLGKMKYFLGVEVNQGKKRISMCQKNYAKEVLERFNMWESNGVKNLIVPGTVVTKAGESGMVDETEYKRLVGSLMYLTVTRPDLMYSVSFISRYMSNPHEEHMYVAKRILRYVKETYDYGLIYDQRGGNKLQVFTDSDYARDVADRKSTSGYVCILSQAAICWSSRKQGIVTLSSTEAEYVAATICAGHCVWLKGLLEEISNEELGTIEIQCDNSSTIKLSKNPVLHRKTKHIDVRYHYLRDLVNEEIIKLLFCPTADQVADVMTKPVKLDSFEKMRKKMGVYKIEE